MRPTAAVTYVEVTADGELDEGAHDVGGLVHALDVLDDYTPSPHQLVVPLVVICILLNCLRLRRGWENKVRTVSLMYRTNKPCKIKERQCIDLESRGHLLYMLKVFLELGRLLPITVYAFSSSFFSSSFSSSSPPSPPASTFK